MPSGFFMYKSFLKSLIVCSIPISLMDFACTKKKDELKVNLAPSTSLEVDTILRSGSNRLTSLVRLRWSGSDADGFVKGYQVVWGFNPISSNDWLNAKTVNVTDSTFLFGFPPGATDTADIHFSVRSIDDKNTPDPNPVSVVVPIKNKTPKVQISSTTFPTGDTILHVFSLQYAASDEDGNENLKYLYFRANQGAWVEIPRSSKFLTLVPRYINNSFTGITDIYFGENLATQIQQPRPYQFTLSGVNPGGQNLFQFKTYDQAGDSALAETPKAWYMKPKLNEFLVVDAYRGSIQPQPESVYFPIFTSLAIGFDLIDFNASYRTLNSQFYNSTLYLYLNQYSKLFWFGDVPQVIEESINSFEQYLRFGGKCVLISTFPTVPKVDRDSPLFPFLAVDSVTWRSASLRTTAVIDSISPGFRVLGLQSTDIVDGVDFLYPRQDSDTLYSMPASSLRSAPVYTGRRLVSTRRKNQVSNKTNLVFFSIDLHRFSKRPGSLESTINHIINQEFNW